jgi:microcystin degradation protein MlrC
MEKLSSTKVASILSQVPATLRAQAEEISSLKEKVAFYERRDRAEKIATDMTRKNLDTETPFEQKVASLMDPSTDLTVIEKAIEMSAHQVKVASLSDHPGAGGDDDAVARFESTLLS